MRTHRRNQAMEPNRALGTRRNATGVLRDKGVHLLCSGVTTAERGTEKCCATAEPNSMLWAFVCPEHCLDPKKGEFCVNFPRFRKGFPCVLVQWSKIQRSTCAYHEQIRFGFGQDSFARLFVRCVSDDDFGRG